MNLNLVWGKLGLVIGKINVYLYSLDMNHISVEAIHDRIKNNSLGNAIIVDVRMSFEVRGGVVPGAVNIPMKEVSAHKDDLMKYNTVYLICQSGGRSEMTGMMLHADGLTQVCNVDGGTMAWREKGYDFELLP